MATMRGSRRHVLPVSLGLILAGCGAHFEAVQGADAVQVAGAAAQRLSSEETVLDAVPALCLEVASLSGSIDDCAPLRAQARAWTRVVALVEAYASSLARLAGPPEGAISREMLVSAGGGEAWAGLKPEEAAAASSLAGVARGLLTARRDDPAVALRKAIDDADPLIQALAQAIDRAVDARVADVDLAETSIDVVRQRLQQAVADRLPTPRPAAVAAPAATKRPGKAASAKAEEQDALVATLLPMNAQLGALSDVIARQALAGQAAVPGALAGLAAVQNDLESTRQRFVRLRDAVDAFARVHRSLHDGMGRGDTDALMASVLKAVGEAAAAAPVPAVAAVRPAASPP